MADTKVAVAEIPEALTIGKIAERFDAPKHRVQYVIDKHELRPSYRAGASFVYDEKTVRRIGEELKKTAESHN